MVKTTYSIYGRLKRVTGLADGLSPEEFLSLLRKRIDKIIENHEHYKERIVKLEQQIAQCDDYEQQRSLKSDRFWAEQHQSEQQRKLEVIDRLLVELGWDMGEGSM